MIKVKFLVDYRGVLTGERFFEAGEVAEFEDKAANQIVKEKRGELVAQKSEPSPTTTTKRTRRTKKAA